MDIPSTDFRRPAERRGHRRADTGDAERVILTPELVVAAQAQTDFDRNRNGQPGCVTGCHAELEITPGFSPSSSTAVSFYCRCPNKERPDDGSAEVPWMAAPKKAQSLHPEPFPISFSIQIGQCTLDVASKTLPTAVSLITLFPVLLLVIVPLVPFHPSPDTRIHASFPSSHRYIDRQSRVLR